MFQFNNSVPNVMGYAELLQLGDQSGTEAAIGVTTWLGL